MALWNDAGSFLDTSLCHLLESFNLAKPGSKNILLKRSYFHSTKMMAARLDYGTWSNTVQAGQELGSAVTNSNLVSIVNQVKMDFNYFNFWGR